MARQSPDPLTTWDVGDDCMMGWPFPIGTMHRGLWTCVTKKKASASGIDWCPSAHTCCFCPLAVLPHTGGGDASHSVIWGGTGGGGGGGGGALSSRPCCKVHCPQANPHPTNTQGWRWSPNACPLSHLVFDVARIERPRRSPHLHRGGMTVCGGRRRLWQRPAAQAPAQDRVPCALAQSAVVVPPSDRRHNRPEILRSRFRARTTGPGPALARAGALRAPVLTAVAREVRRRAVLRIRGRGTCGPWPRRPRRRTLCTYNNTRSE